MKNKMYLILTVTILIFACSIFVNAFVDNFGDGDLADNGYDYGLKTLVRLDMSQNRSHYVENIFDSKWNAFLYGAVNISNASGNTTSWIGQTALGCSGGLLNLSPNILPTNESFTISLWDKRGNNDWTGLAEFNHLYIDAYTDYRYKIFSNESNHAIWTSASLSNPGEFNHLVVTYDKYNVNITAYVNGKYAGSIQPYKGNFTFGRKGFLCHTFPKGTLSNGYIDEFMILNQSVTPEMVLELYQSGFNRTRDYRTNVTNWVMPRTAYLTNLNFSRVLYSAENLSKWWINYTVPVKANFTAELVVKSLDGEPCGVSDGYYNTTTVSAFYRSLTLVRNNATVPYVTVSLLANRCVYDGIAIYEHNENTDQYTSTGYKADNSSAKIETLLGSSYDFSAPVLFFERIDELFNCSAADTPSGGLISWWRLEKNNIAEDVCGRHDGSYGTQTTLNSTPGIQGNGLTFNRTSTISNTGLNFTNARSISHVFKDAITICAWAKKDEWQFTMDPVAKGTNSAYEMEIRLASNNITAFYIYPPDGSGVEWYCGINQATSGIHYDEWNHYCMVYINNTNLTGYINGRPLCTDTTSGGTPASYGTAQFTIGKRANAYPFNGSVDEVMYWNKSLTAGEIKDVYQYGGLRTFPSKGLTPVCAWNFNKGWTNSTHVIGSQYPFNDNCKAKITGSVFWVNESISGQAAWFNGSNDYLVTSETMRTNNQNQLSILAWVKRSSNIGDDGDIVTKYVATSGGRSFGLRILNNKTNGFISANGATATSLSGTTILQEDTWYHLAFVYNGSHIEVYVNGKRDSTAPTAFSGEWYNNAYPIEIGRGRASQNFNGSIDEIYIYDVALTDTDVQQLYYRNFSLLPTEHNSTHLWRANVTYTDASAVAYVNLTTNPIQFYDRCLPYGFKGQWRLDGLNCEFIGGNNIIDGRKLGFAMVLESYTNYTISSQAVLEASKFEIQQGSWLAIQGNFSIT